ncbi:MAG: prepilin peptidase [Verrucomicrobiia bacterium]|jgi:leader peptidase (prepilin peptidase) / N-methyltransferase
MLAAIFDSQYWAVMPPLYWSAVFFIFGSMVGSFLNVCIYRMPLEQSVVRPGSHCPSCKYAIPLYHNIPLITWLQLRGKCANCGAPFSARYFLVELLTGITFLSCWLVFGPVSPLLALANCMLLSGFIVATMIDFEHFIIPDEVTLGGIVAGFIAAALVPALHGAGSLTANMGQSLLGICIGGGVIYAILRAGKLMFGKKRISLEANSKLLFTDTSLHLGNEEYPYDELFYRKTDFVSFRAKTLELADRCYKDVPVRLTQARLTIGEESFDPEPVKFMEAIADEIVLPQEAMGLGDVKFMAAIGAFLGWQATMFALMFSSLIGSVVGISLIAIGKRSWSARLPYGPYIALAAVVWVFMDSALQSTWKDMLSSYAQAFR